MQIGEEIKKKLKAEKSSVPKLAKVLEIPEDRIYKWTQGVAEPKNEDRDKVKNWLNPEQVPRGTKEDSPYMLQRRSLKNGLLKALSGLPFDPIPAHDIDIAASNNVELYDDNSQDATDYYYIPEFSGCRAFNVFADSMDPLIPKGARIFAKKIDDWQEVLEYGQVYAIGLHDGRRFLKYVRKGGNEERFLLRSENTKYEDFEVPKKKIRSIWLIDGWMNKSTQSTFFILKHNLKTK